MYKDEDLDGGDSCRRVLGKGPGENIQGSRAHLEIIGVSNDFPLFRTEVSNSECITRELNPEAFLLRVGIKTPLFG